MSRAWPLRMWLWCRREEGFATNQHSDLDRLTDTTGSFAHLQNQGGGAVRLGNLAGCRSAWFRCSDKDPAGSGAWPAPTQAGGGEVRVWVAAQCTAKYSSQPCLTRKPGCSNWKFSQPSNTWAESVRQSWLFAKPSQWPVSGRKLGAWVSLSQDHKQQHPCLQWHLNRVSSPGLSPFAEQNWCSHLARELRAQSCLI